ncbi:hypothetical protein CDT91_21885 [Cronobacter sakazakii]|nr:hypothetical protein CDT91_21885 [Cronobacter sakazakii]
MVWRRTGNLYWRPRLRLFRYDGHNGLHCFSGYENLQFENASSMAWFGRLDEASIKQNNVEAQRSREP